MKARIKIDKMSKIPKTCGECIFINRGGCKNIYYYCTIKSSTVSYDSGIVNPNHSCEDCPIRLGEDGKVEAIFEINEMPADCGYCNFCEMYSLGEYCCKLSCISDDLEIEVDPYHKNKNCPLKELKENNNDDLY